MFGYKEELQYEISGLKDEIRELKAENEKLKLRLSDVSNRRELLLAYENYCDKMSKIYENPRSKILLIDAFLSQ
jgi:regulator of replication initiation timing